MDVWTGQFHAAHLVGRGFKAATMDADDETGLRDIADWWHTNDMDRYLFRLLSNAQLDLINHEANGVLSRSDLHQALEAYQFVFVPKEGKNSAHVLGSSARDLAQEVHNVPARIHRNTEEAYLLVRFAKAIIRLVELNQAGFRKQQHLLVTSIHTVSDKAASSSNQRAGQKRRWSQASDDTYVAQLVQKLADRPLQAAVSTVVELGLPQSEYLEVLQRLNHEAMARL
ncbi:MAG: hypothetical protein CYPHOPRED_004435 [Cyphobasidiales sp. Tagirdzhanova-0007]|nr:MAG: hypothetical protein CYPHOPRED_004435 [Cyphobasidiales sp. Tagirdzhanova-0007]